MELFFKDYLNRMMDLHNQIEKTFEGLPAVALDWKVSPDIPYMCVLVSHIVEAERYWIGDVATGELSGRDLEAEFKTTDCQKRIMLDLLLKSYDFTHGFLGGLSVEDLPNQRICDRDGKPYTIGGSLLHALEHSAIHLGHLQIVRQVWDMQDY